MTPFQLAARGVLLTHTSPVSAATFNSITRDTVHYRFSELRNYGKGWEVGVRANTLFVTREWYPIDMESIETHDELLSVIRTLCALAR